MNYLIKQLAVAIVMIIGFSQQESLHAAEQIKPIEERVQEEPIIKMIQESGVGYKMRIKLTDTNTHGEKVVYKDQQSDGQVIYACTRVYARMVLPSWGSQKMLKDEFNAVQKLYEQQDVKWVSDNSDEKITLKVEK